MWGFFSSTTSSKSVSFHFPPFPNRAGAWISLGEATAAGLGGGGDCGISNMYQKIGNNPETQIPNGNECACWLDIAQGANFSGLDMYVTPIVGRPVKANFVINSD